MIAPVMAGTLVGSSLATAAAAITEASSGSGFDPFTLIGSTITPVIVIVLLLTGKLHTDVDYKHLEKYASREHDERVQLLTVVTETVLPNQHRATVIMELLLPFIEAEFRVRQVRDELHPPGGSN